MEFYQKLQENWTENGNKNIDLYQYFLSQMSYRLEISAVWLLYHPKSNPMIENTQFRNHKLPRLGVLCYTVQKELFGAEAIKFRANSPLNRDERQMQMSVDIFPFRILELVHFPFFAAAFSPPFFFGLKFIRSSRLP